MYITVGVPAIFFLSGFASLIFQVAWRKVLSQTIGLDFISSTLIVSIFMLGLALGAEIGAQCVRRMRRPLVAYFVAELCVSAFGLVSIALLHAAPSISQLFGTGIGFSGYASDFVVNAAILLIPTVLMGVSFPIISHLFRNLLVPGAAVGFLYSANIAGAASGALIGGFWLIGTVGLMWTAIAAAVLNLVQVAYVARLILTSQDEAALTKVSGPRDDVRSRNIILLIAFAIGFAALSYEMIFIRMATIYFTANSYVFPVVVSSYLVLMAIGNSLTGQLLNRGLKPTSLFAGLGIAVVVTSLFSLLLPFALRRFGVNLEIFQISLETFLEGGWSALIVKTALIALTMMLPVIPISGLFPVFVHTLTTDRANIGSNVGSVYFVQTIGNVTGVLVSGLWLLPTYGLVGTIKIMVLLATLSVVAFYLVVAQRRQVTSRSVCVAAIYVFLLAVTVLVSPKSFYDTFSFDGRKPTRFSEELEGVSLKFDSSGGTLLLMGTERSTSYARTDPLRTGIEDVLPFYEAITQNPVKKVLVIGIGTGFLAIQAKQRFPDAEIVVVELLDVVIREMKQFGSTALKDLLHNSKVYITDGRRYVARKAINESDRFDLIQVGVFHVTSSGAGSLFTTEFQAQMRKLLSPNGALSFNAYLSAVKSGYEVFEKGIVVVRELGRQVADVIFFNNDQTDLIAGLKRYPATIDAYRRDLQNTSTLVTEIPSWYFSFDDPRYVFIDKAAILSSLSNIARQTDDLVATEPCSAPRRGWTACAFFAKEPGLSSPSILDFSPTAMSLSA
jgi:spermidine synthase